MKRMIPGLISVVLLAPFWQTTTNAQTPAPATKPSATFQPAPAVNGPIPTVAFDITKADIDFVLKNAAPPESVIAEAIDRLSGDPQALAYRWTVVLGVG